MKYTSVSVRQLDRKGKPWQARAKYKDVYGKARLALSFRFIFRLLRQSVTPRC